MFYYDWKLCKNNIFKNVYTFLNYKCSSIKDSPCIAKLDRYTISPRCDVVIQDKMRRDEETTTFSVSQQNSSWIIIIIYVITGRSSYCYYYYYFNWKNSRKKIRKYVLLPGRRSSGTRFMTVKKWFKWCINTIIIDGRLEGGGWGIAWFGLTMSVYYTLW